MKIKTRLLLPTFATCVLSSSIHASVLTWDLIPSDGFVTGGAGDWTTTDAFWTSDAGVTNNTWPAVSTGDDDASFGDIGGAVTIQAGGISANDISFQVNGYSLGGDTLTLDGATNVITAVPNSNNVATISAPIAGTTGFTKAGQGTLTVNGTNTGLSGTITVSNATGTNNAGLILSGADATGTVSTFNVNGSAAPTADGGWLGLANGATIASTSTVNLSGQGGNSAPPGTLRCTSGLATVNGTVNLLTSNVRISSGGTGGQLVINGRITDNGNGYGVSFRFGDGNGIHLTNTTNSWTGDTTLGQGVLRVDPGALPSTIKLVIAGSASGWLQTSGSLNRPLGTTSGGGVIDMSSNAANKVVGLGARGGDLTVNFGGAAAPVVWGVTSGFNPAILGLNNSSADSKLNLVNPLDLNGAARVIQVDANTAVLQASVKNTSATAASLRKTGAGTLEHDPGSSHTVSLAGLNTGGGTMRFKSGTYTVSGSAGTSQPDGTNGFIVSKGGSFHLDGATITCTGGSFVFPAGNTAGGNSSFVLDSGTLDGGAREALNAYGANGTTTLNGGLFVCGDFRVGQSSTCGLNLNGGILRTNRLKDATSTTATVNLNGGTLQAKGAQSSFIDPALDVVNVQAGGAVIDSNGFNITIPRALTADTGSPGGGLVKRGGGILDLTVASTYTGDTVIEGGVLRVSDTAQLGASGAQVVVDGGQLGVSGTSIPSVSSLARTVNYYNGGFHVADAAHTFNVDIDLQGTGGLSKSGSGTLKLSGNNDFTGNISGGSGDFGWIEVDSATDLGVGPKTADFTASSQSGLGGIRLLGGITVAGVALNISGRNVDAATQHVLHNVSGNNTWTGNINIAGTGGTYYLRSDAGRLELSGTLSNAQPATGTPDTRAFNLEGPGDFLISGVIANGANANRITGLTVDNTGTTTLTGINTYTGSTTVNAGTLLIHGNNSAATGAIAVNNTATLGGSGSLGGAITVGATATLAPGASAGTLSTSANVGGSGKLAIELNGAAADKLVLTGTGAIDISSLNLDVTTLGGGSTEAVYVIVDSAAAITGAAFAGVTGIPSGYTLVYNYNDGVDSNNIALVSGAADPFTSWATTTHGLAGGNAAPTADPDNDGLDNSIEFVIGGQPNPANPGANSSALAPVVSTDTSNLIFTFRRTDLSMTQPGISVLTEYGSNLTGWTTAVNGVNGISINATDDFYGAGVDRVVVTIPKTLATASSFFARLKVVLP